MKPTSTTEDLGSPDSIHNTISGSSYYQKSAYHQSLSGLNGLPYTGQQNLGMQYPAPFAAQAPVYPPAGAGYFPSVYPGNEHPQVQYYLVPGAGGTWAMQPVSFYPPQAYGQTGSPPNTPLAYGYPAPPVSEQDLYSGSQSNHGGNIHMNLPGLDHRRNSWSSSATESPITPFVAASDPAPAVYGDHRYSVPSKPMKGKSINDMIKNGPPIPAPVYGQFVHPRGASPHSLLENPTHTTNVYVRGLPPDTDDDKLYEMTVRFGNVTSHKAILDTEHGTCKG